MTLKTLAYFFHYCVLLLLTSAFFSCGSAPQEKFTIAFSQCTVGPWREIMLQEMKRELLFHPNVTFLYRQAEAKTQTQIEQTRELLRQNPDLLIISPNEAAPLSPVVEEAFKKGIPVIVIDRKISSPIYTAYVGGDNYGVGRMAGEYAVNLLRGRGRIIEVTVLPGSSPAAERHKGFADAITSYPGMQLVQQVNGELLKEPSAKKLDTIFNKQTEADLVFAQNDFLAIRVTNLYRKKGLPVPYIIGVDGLPGKGEGMQLVQEGHITATMLYPTGGEEAIRTAIRILKKQPFTRENLLGTTVIDSTNVRFLQVQAEKMQKQQRSIERQQKVMEDLKAIYNNQRTFVYILILSLALTILLAVQGAWHVPAGCWSPTAV